ncbi:hypothetical protein A3L12_08170 [Thermococcus sp. P6]|uniref:hypothetical protein n=1 Tax=Thermococcus sp. P6 TaxID=122420 RepID=UPI000B59FFF9|nr:hypothetical protein [Thermococcus sp. P6]ASJ11270.1 hypothetical protein A3L12_08170 [Thermococcus sp. P6]
MILTFVYFLFGFLLAFCPFTGIPAILIGILFVKIDTKAKLAYSLAGFVAGTLAGVSLWGSSWIFEQLRWDYQEHGIWGFIGGTTIILLLAILLARVLNKKYPMGDAK